MDDQATAKATTRTGFREREAPEAVLVQLREIDPDADLLYLGGGEWLLGVRKGNTAAREKAKELLKVMKSRKPLDDPLAAAEEAKRIELINLCANEGFRPVAIYDTPEESIEDFRQRDFRWRTAFEETLKARAAEAELGTTEEAIRAEWDDYKPEARFIYRHFLGGVKRFVQRVSLFN